MKVDLHWRHEVIQSADWGILATLKGFYYNALALLRDGRQTVGNQ